MTLLLPNRARRFPLACGPAPQTLGVLVAAVALLVSFVVIERRSDAPLVPFSFFRLRSVSAANATMLALGAAVIGLFYFLSLYLQKVLGYSAITAGISQLPLAVGIILAAGLASPLVNRLGIRPVLVAGLALFAGGLVWFAQLPVHGDYLADALGPSLLIALGLGLAFVPITILAETGVTDRDYGLASGLVNTSQQIGGALGLAVLSTIATSRTNHLAAAHHPINQGIDARLPHRLPRRRRVRTARDHRRRVDRHPPRQARRARRRNGRQPELLTSDDPRHPGKLRSPAATHGQPARL